MPMQEKERTQGYLTIKEFSELVGITAKSLRHYDNKGVFRPARRGVEFNNQYRYYSPPQIITAKLIRVLTEIGVPLETIKDLAKSRTPDRVLSVLYENRDIIADDIQFYQDAYSVVSAFIELIQEGLTVIETDITVAERAERRIILGDENRFTDPGIFLDEYIRFYKSMHKPSLNISFPVGAYWPDINSFFRDPVSPARFFSLDPKGNERKKAGLYLIGYSKGYYGHINDLPKRMEVFAHKNDLRFTGAVYGTYLHDEISIIDHDQYLLQISALVAKNWRAPARRPRRHK